MPVSKSTNVPFVQSRFWISARLEQSGQQRRALWLQLDAPSVFGQPAGFRLEEEGSEGEGHGPSWIAAVYRTAIRQRQ
jgi:hypothetical protein